MIPTIGFKKCWFSVCMNVSVYLCIDIVGILPHYAKMWCRWFAPRSADRSPAAPGTRSRPSPWIYEHHYPKSFIQLKSSVSPSESYSNSQPQHPHDVIPDALREVPLRVRFVVVLDAVLVPLILGVACVKRGSGGVLGAPVEPGDQIREPQRLSRHSRRRVARVNHRVSDWLGWPEDGCCFFYLNWFLQIEK